MQGGIPSSEVCHRSPTLTPQIALACAFHIAENRLFVNGNKRAAIGAALVFLDINGVNFPEAMGRYTRLRSTLHEA